VAYSGAAIPLDGGDSILMARIDKMTKKMSRGGEETKGRSMVRHG